MTPRRIRQLSNILQRLQGLHPKLIDLSLERVGRLLEKLGNPQDKLAPVIHVAGTNGKGSVIAFLRFCLEAAGYKVQAYTSPHLIRFNERIRMVGGEIGDENLAEILTECEEANDENQITFFEITTAAAFLAFSREPADLVLLETGLGGRLDATNLVKRPLLTAITPVSVDHCQYLGNTLSAIAAEKAGILKSGVTCVLAQQSPQGMQAIEKRAKEIGAPLFMGLTRKLPSLGLQGAHQVQNASLAVACLEKLNGFTVSEDNIRKGLKNTHWPGRLQRLEYKALPLGWELWLDGAHNTEGARALTTQMQNWKDKPLHLILGMMKGKDVMKFLKTVVNSPKSIYAVTIPGEEGSLSAQELSQIAKDLGIQCNPAENIQAAIKKMTTASLKPARVLICGSLYLVGAMLNEL